jgi:hypothetical protein
VLDPTHARGATGGFGAATSAPRPGSPLPHLHRDSSVPVQDEPFEMNDAAQFIFKRKHLHMFNRCLTRNSVRPSNRTRIAIIIQSVFSVPLFTRRNRRRIQSTA